MTTTQDVFNLYKLEEAIKTQHVCLRQARQRCASVSGRVLCILGRSPLERLDGITTPYSAVELAIQTGRVSVRKHQRKHSM